MEQDTSRQTNGPDINGNNSLPIRVLINCFTILYTNGLGTKHSSEKLVYLD